MEGHKSNLSHQRARDLIQAASLEALLQPEQTALEEHLVGCAGCQEYRQQMDEVARELRLALHERWDGVNNPLERIVEQTLRKGRRLAMFQKNFGFAAAAAGLVALVLLVVFAMSLLPEQENQPGMPVETQEITSTPVETPQFTEEALSESLRLLSPDGSWTVVLNAGGLEVIGAGGENQTLYPPGSTVNDAKWSPDGKRLAVAMTNLPANWRYGDEAADPPEIHLVDFEDHIFSLVEPFYRADDGAIGGTIILGAWSPDSQYLIFWTGSLSASRQADGLPLWVLDTDRMQAASLSKASLVNLSYQSWAPDSSAVIYTDGGYRSAQVWKSLAHYDVTSSNVKTLIPENELVPGSLAWSPAGNIIAFAAVEASQTGSEWADFSGWDNPAIQARRIWNLGPNAGEYRRLNATEAYQDSPLWRSDGNRLYYVQIEGETAVVMEADPVSGEAGPLPNCQAPLPPGAGYYGQTDWQALFAACPETSPLVQAGTKVSLATPTPTIEVQPQSSTPELLYVTQTGEVFTRSLDGASRTLTRLPEGGAVLDAVEAEGRLYVLTESNLLAADPAGGASQILAAFEKQVLYGELLPLGEGKLLYSIAMHNWNEKGLGFIDTTSNEQFFTPFEDRYLFPLGLEAAGGQLTGVLRGGDPQCKEFTLMDPATGQVSGSLPASDPPGQAYGEEYAALSPDGRYLAFATSQFVTPEAREFRLSLYDFSTGTAALQSYALPQPDSHIFGGILAAPDSRSFYFLLRPGDKYSDPTTSRGLWRFELASGGFTQVAELSDPTLHLAFLEPDGEWLLIRSESSELIYVHLPTGDTHAIGLDGSQEAVVVRRYVPGFGGETGVSQPTARAAVTPTLPASTCTEVERLPLDSPEAQQIREEFVANFKEQNTTEYMGLAVLHRIDRMGEWAIIQGSVSGDGQDVIVVR